MRLERHLRRGVVIAGALLSGAGGCMLISPLDDYPSEGGEGGAGALNAGGSGNDTPMAGAENMGGEAGAPPLVDRDCQTNADCAKGGGSEAYRCRSSDHTCQVVKTGECPIVEGDFADPNAIFFGSFANLNTTDTTNNAIVQAQLLALDDFSGENRGGLRDPSGGPRRPLVLVVCDNRETAVTEGLRHLIEDLEVPGVLATLRPADLRRGFDKYGSRDVFFMSPVSVTRPIVTQEDNDLIWNLLGQPSDFEGAYKKLLEHAEDYVRAQHAIAAEDDIKVALVTTDSAFDSELEELVSPQLRFNGEFTSTNQAEGNYQGFTISPEDDLVAAAVAIASFEPDIIVSMSGGVMTPPEGLIKHIEAEWGIAAEGMPLPLFLLSPYDTGDLGFVYQQIRGNIADDAELTAANRFIGIAIASAEDTSLQNAYAVRLGNKFKGAYTDTANYYDAFYYLAFATYAAGTDEPLTGAGIARGMKRLLSGPRFTPVPTTILDAFDVLDEPEQTITLESTLGPPGFDPINGTRPIVAGLLCFTSFGENVTLHRDVRRFDGATGKFVGQGAFCDSNLVP